MALPTDMGLIDISGTTPNDDVAFVWPILSGALSRELDEFVRSGISALVGDYNKSTPQARTPRLERNLLLKLSGLEDVTLTNRLPPATRNKLRKGLEIVSSNPRFPSEAKKLAQDLIQEYSEQSWGSSMTEFQDEEPDLDEHDSRITTSTSLSDDNGARIIRRPHPNHPIFGLQGVMRGVLLKPGSRVTYLDPNRPKFNAKRYGHNGFRVGDWFPRQMAAVARGCHGAPMGGICYGQDGAISIVVGGNRYEELDKDKGEVLYYSGSGSHDNKDPQIHKETGGTQSLILSISSSRPVRVLRKAASGTRGSWPKPECGVRYDGL
jgi:hypothetical protein